MKVITCQRWRARRAVYRLSDEADVIDTRACEIEEFAGDEIPKAFVLEHHYSGSFPASRVPYGLRLKGGRLGGVAVFSHPCRDTVLTNVFPGVATDSVELGRFVLLDEVPSNGETWFLARCFERLRRRDLRGVLSFSDPVARTSTAGVTVFPGHVGTIYQAHNAQYLGRATSRTLRLLPDGSVLNARAIQKIRSGDQGWRYSAALLEAHGATPAPTSTGDRLMWLTVWLQRLTRGLKHPGNHRYAWPLRRGVSVAMPSQAYPKAFATGVVA